MRRDGRGVVNASGYGLIAGLLLTFLFKGVEYSTGVKVYTFLLNIDYIPALGSVEYPEWIEVVFHLVVSMAVAFGFYLMYRLRPSWRKRAISICTAGSTVIGIALFPTTALSDRTPEITDGLALFHWLLGHALFGAVLGVFFRMEKKAKSTSARNKG